MKTDRLIDKSNIKQNALVPLLHIKLRSAKLFIKSLKNPKAKAIISDNDIFLHLSKANVKNGILNGTQIRRLLQNDNFKSALSPIENAAWKSFQSVCENFLDKHKDPEYKNIV